MAESLFVIVAIVVIVAITLGRDDAERERKEAERTERRAAAYRDHFPMSTTVISVDDRQSVAKAFSRAIVGEMLFGGAGAFIGAATTETKQKVTFRVEYESGRVGTETVRVGSERFSLLWSKVK